MRGPDRPACHTRPRGLPTRDSLLAAGSLLAAAVLAGCGLLPENPGTERWEPPGGPAKAGTIASREACASRDHLRQPFFGDLHVHTGYSMDANIRETRLTPDDAYRFATGEPIAIAPLDGQGRGTRRVRIDRPLDFAAVTDHAEWMGEVALCTDARDPAYDTDGCRIFRGEEESWLAWLFGATGAHARVVGVVGIRGRNHEVCGANAASCRRALKSIWTRTQEAAERYYDRTADCRFTTFPAWEYSRSPGRSKIHRNVLFRNEVVPELPLSWIDTPTESLLWQRLHERCLDRGVGCDVLAIPHNPNLSNGQMFDLWYRELPRKDQRAAASLRASIEPLAEMMQVKGESECANGMYDVVGGNDELCDFEKIRGVGDMAPEDCEERTGAGALKGEGCRSRLDFVRYALIEGLRESVRIGVNPYKLGFVGSTDTHNATPGAVTESTYHGAEGNEDSDRRQRLASAPPGEAQSDKEITRNPGGLAGIWAEENSRDSLFDAMRRRETFATSGPRIAPRFFGGWELPEDLCDRADLVERGYALGVPMGGDLPPREESSRPTFVVTATADVGTPERPGGLLQRAQIVKGWAGPDGRFHQAIYDVAGTSENGASVDPSDCSASGPGYRSLCGVWRDPDFDPDTPAVYYARIVENPSCRWSWWQCLELAPADRPDGCADPTIPRTIQERAWTSPIWYDSAVGARGVPAPSGNRPMPLAHAPGDRGAALASPLPLAPRGTRRKQATKSEVDLVAMLRYRATRPCDPIAFLQPTTPSTDRSDQPAADAGGSA